MVKTDFDFGMLQSKAYLLESTRPFIWTGLICGAYGYIPHSLYEAPVLLYFGLAMAAVGLGIRTFSTPLISTVQTLRQLRSGGLPLTDLIKRLTFLAALIGASIGGTGLLGYFFYQLAGLTPG